jgi:hypothetical protein
MQGVVVVELSVEVQLVQEVQVAVELLVHQMVAQETTGHPIEAVVVVGRLITKHLQIMDLLVEQVVQGWLFYQSLLQDILEQPLALLQ